MAHSRENGSELPSGYLSLFDGGVISTDALGEGGGGNVTIRARESVTVSGRDPADPVDGSFSAIIARTDSSSSGGDVLIETTELSLFDGGVISTDAFGEGDGGNVIIKASESVTVSGRNPVNGSTSFMIAQTFSSGSAGEVFIETTELNVTDGGQISTATVGEGDGGNVTIRARESVTVSGSDPAEGFASFISAEANFVSSGLAGDVLIETTELNVTDSGQISTATVGEGDGGNVTIRARESVTVSGRNPMAGPSSAITAETNRSGSGGNVLIETTELSVTEGGRISSRATSKGDGGNVLIETTELSVTDDGQISSGTSGEGDGGNVLIETTELSVTDDGQISSGTSGEGDGGNVIIRASESVTVSDRDSMDFSNSFISSSSSFSTGSAGDVLIETTKLSVTEGGLISSGTSGEGDGGSVLIETTVLSVTDGGLIRGGTLGKGDGGSVLIGTTKLSVADGGQIRGDTSGEGDGGNVTIRARESVTISGRNPFNSASAITAGARSSGSGGDVLIETTELSVTDGGQISSLTSGTGGGGRVTIRASESVTLSGNVHVNGLSSFISVRATLGSSGSAGDVLIETTELRVTNGGLISSGTSGEGDGGSMTIRASESVILSGNDPVDGISSVISAETFGLGSAGDMFIETTELSVNDGGRISSSTFREGAGGNVTIRASESVTLSGSDPVNRFSSFITAQTARSGLAGDVLIETTELRIFDGGRISSGTSGEGAGGNVTIRASESVTLSGRSPRNALPSAIATDSFGTGKGGSIIVSARQLELRNSAQTTAEAFHIGNAGSINIEVVQIILIDGCDRSPSGVSCGCDRSPSGVSCCHWEFNSLRHTNRFDVFSVRI